MILLHWNNRVIKSGGGATPGIWSLSNRTLPFVTLWLKLGGCVQQHQHRFAGTQLDPSLLCQKTTVLSIEHPTNTKGWMTQEDWGAEFRMLNKTEHPFIQIGLDGESCFQTPPPQSPHASRACC